MSYESNHCRWLLLLVAAAAAVLQSLELLDAALNTANFQAPPQPTEIRNAHSSIHGKAIQNEFKTNLPVGPAALSGASPMDENSEALRLLLKDEERPKRLRENDFGGDTNDPIAIAEEFTKTVAVIATAGNRMLHRSSTGSDLLYERRFRAHFGCRIVYSCFRRLRKVLSSNVTENTRMGL